MFNYKATQEKYQNILKSLNLSDEKVSVLPFLKPIKKGERLFLCGDEVRVKKASSSLRSLPIEKRQSFAEKLKSSFRVSDIKIQQDKLYNFLNFAEELSFLKYIPLTEQEVRTIKEKLFKKGLTEKCCISFLYNVFSKNKEIENPMGFILSLISKDEHLQFIDDKLIEEARQIELFSQVEKTFITEITTDLRKFEGVVTTKFCGFLPLGVFSHYRKQKITHFEVKYKEKNKTVKYSLDNPRGLPTSLAYDIRRALAILYSERQEQFIKVKAYEFLSKLNLSVGTKTYKEIEKQLTRLIDTAYTLKIKTIESNKETEVTLRIDPILKGFSVQREKGQGGENRVYSFAFSDDFIRAVQKRYFYLIHNQLFRSLKHPISKRLLEIILPRINALKDSEYAIFNFEELCSLSGLKFTKEKRRIYEKKRLIKKSLEELKDNNIIKDYEFFKKGTEIYLRIFKP